MNEEITRSSVIDPEEINPHDWCYQFSKYVPDFLLGKLTTRYYRDEPHFLQK